jgi:hypothetical protein
MCWYGTSGAGKGYSLRVLLSRERFANGLRVYGSTRTTQQEYAGRFCDYLGGMRVPIRTLAEAEDFHFIGVDLGPGRNDDVVIWDLQVGRTRPRRHLRRTENATRRAPTSAPRARGIHR